MNLVSFVRTVATICLLLASGATWAQQAPEVVPPRVGILDLMAQVHQVRISLPRTALQGFSVVLVLGDLQGGAATSDNMPAAARAALGDIKDFLPFKSYRVLDTAWILASSGAASGRLRGADDQDYVVGLDSTLAPPPSTVHVKFRLREPGPEKTGASSGLSDKFRDELTELHLRRTELELALKASSERPNQSREIEQTREALGATNRRIAALQAQGGALSAAATLIDTSFTMEIGETVVVGTSRVRGDKALIALLTAVPRTTPAK